MSTYIDRCAAVTAALQDLARDLEADLGKTARWRGGAGFDTPHLRDPGADIDAIARQWAELATRRDLRVAVQLKSYKHVAGTAGAMVHISAPAGEDRAARDAVLALIAAIQAVENHDDAIALVATFTEGE